MTESKNSSQIPVKLKKEYKNFKSWKFLDIIQPDVLAGYFEVRKMSWLSTSELEQLPIG